MHGDETEPDKKSETDQAKELAPDLAAEQQADLMQEPEPEHFSTNFLMCCVLHVFVPAVQSQQKSKKKHELLKELIEEFHN